MIDIYLKTYKNRYEKDDTLVEIWSNRNPDDIESMEIFVSCNDTDTVKDWIINALDVFLNYADVIGYDEIKYAISKLDIDKIASQIIKLSKEGKTVALVLEIKDTGSGQNA